MSGIDAPAETTRQPAIGFDVYGTLVDPIDLKRQLQALAGDQAERFAELWREKQIEYAFRRGLMRSYETFSVCTQQALHYTMHALDVTLDPDDQHRILDAYGHLSPFSDVAPGLETLKAQGHAVVAFSNGVERSVRDLLRRAGVDGFLDDVVSVDDLRTFKPDPEVYRFLAQRVGRPPEDTWLVSSNPWDVIGAKSAGLRAAWVKRSPDVVFDPWGIEPDLVITTLEELATRLSERIRL